MWERLRIHGVEMAVQNQGMKHTPEMIEAIRKRRDDMWPILNEQGRRLFAASGARALGHGGVSFVEKAIGVARSTINRGIEELKKSGPITKKQRRPGSV